MPLTPILSPSGPQISKRNLKNAEVPQTPQQDLLNLAFKIFNNREEQAKLEKAQGDQAKYYLFSHCPTWLQASTNQKKKKKKPAGPCFKCSKEGYWGCSCLKPRPPPGPCPSCGIKGHWKVDCPNPPPEIQTSPPSAK